MLSTTTTFLPQARMRSMNARSVSVNGRSAEVTNSTRSARGHEVAGDLLVLAHDGVGAGRVDDGHVAQQIERVADLEQRALAPLGRRRRVAQRG